MGRPCKCSRREQEGTESVAFHDSSYGMKVWGGQHLAFRLRPSLPGRMHASSPRIRAVPLRALLARTRARLLPSESQPAAGTRARQFAKRFPARGAGVLFRVEIDDVLRGAARLGRQLRQEVTVDRRGGSLEVLARDREQRLGASRVAAGTGRRQQFGLDPVTAEHGVQLAHTRKAALGQDLDRCVGHGGENGSACGVCEEEQRFRVEREARGADDAGPPCRSIPC